MSVHTHVRTILAQRYIKISSEIVTVFGKLVIEYPDSNIKEMCEKAAALMITIIF